MSSEDRGEWSSSPLLQELKREEGVEAAELLAELDLCRGELPVEEDP